MTRYLLFDVDGVLADCTHRLKFAKDKDYEKFYGDKQMSDDTPIDGGWELLRILFTTENYVEEDVKLIIVTGRPDYKQKITDMWLAYQNTQGFYFPRVDAYYMRREGDYRPSPVVKRELVQKFMVDFSPEKDDTIIFIDDDPANTEAVAEFSDKIITLTFGANRFDMFRKEKVNGGQKSDGGSKQTP